MLRIGLNSIIKNLVKSPTPLLASTKYGIFNANKIFNGYLMEGY